MKAYSLIASLALLAAAALNAQTTAQITLNFSGTLDAVCFPATSSNPPFNHSILTVTGSGTITPFGGASRSGSEALLTFGGAPPPADRFTFTFPNGDSFWVSSFFLAGCAPSIFADTFPIVGSTGAFQNATGSLTIAGPALALAICESPSEPPNKYGPYCPASFQVTGTGTITTPGKSFVSPSALPFSFLQGSSSPSSVSLTLTNGTVQSAPISTTTSGQTWLSVSTSSPNVAAFSSATATVTVNPSGLAPGTYTATVTLSAAGQQFIVPVTVTISSAQLAIAISQTALRFQMAAGTSAPPSQSITVLNQGTGPLSWSAKASTLAGITDANGLASTQIVLGTAPAGVQVNVQTSTLLSLPSEASPAC